MRSTEWTYRLTPLNFVSALIAGGELLIIVYPEVIKNEHYGYQHFYLIPIFLFGFILDFGFQKVFKRYITLIVFETILIILFFFINNN